jgi:UDP-2,3-diacylglucosamine hydrolase
MPALPPPAVLQAPAHWQTVEFISDLHLQPAEPATVSAWQNYMAGTTADAVFILGDLFEVWVGDDVLDDATSFESQCATVLRNTAQRCDLFFLHGNRDFLIGNRFAEACGLRLLDDPTVLLLHHQRWLLSHGDALCLDDTDYMQFRAQVRQNDWQAAFLARPLAERQAMARSMRERSEARKKSAAVYADVDPHEAIAWLQAAQAPALVHGHTHKPATHALTDTLQRVVLSDWDLAATPPRAEVLRLAAQGLQRVGLAG